MLIFVERKVAAWVQDRHGPNRVGPAGLLQSVADGLKFLLKEDVIPSHVDRKLFVLAPCVALVTAMLAFAVVPFGPTEPSKEKAPVAPNEPANRPSSVDPCACAASSISAIPRSSHSARSAVMSGLIIPPMWTCTTAAVCGVSTGSTVARLSASVLSSTSANTGRPPACSTAAAVA